MVAFSTSSGVEAREPLPHLRMVVNSSICVYFNRGGRFLGYKTPLNPHAFDADRCGRFTYGDINGDGRLDQINTSGVFLGHGDGQFSIQMVEFTYTSNVWGAKLLSGDVNNDGFWDVLAHRGDWDFNGFRLFWGKPDGTLEEGGIVPLRIISPGFGVFVWFRLVDFDGDGNLDIIGGSQEHGLVARGDGTGKFEVTAEIYEASRARVVDLDEDGRLDIVTLGGAPPDIPGASPRLAALVYMGTGAGTVAPPLALPIRRSDPDRINVSAFMGVAAGDFDGDGFMDIVACGRDLWQLAVFRGRGDGTFDEEFYLDPPVADLPSAVLLHDLDLDGRDDLVVGYRWKRAEIYWGEPGGGIDFSNPHRIQSWQVSWIEAQTGIDWEFIRGDADRDGSVDLSDAIAILEQLFLGRRVDCGDASDADDSGRVEITDPVYLLEYLFLGGKSPPYPFPEAAGDFTWDSGTGIAGKPGGVGDLGCAFETWYYRSWTFCPPDAPDCDWPPPQIIDLGGKRIIGF